MFSAITQKAISRIVLGDILPIIAFVTIGLWITYDRRLPFDPESLRGATIEKSVKGAQEIRIVWSLYRNRICPTTIAREFVDSVGVVHRTETIVGPISDTLGNDTWVSTVRVPAMPAWGPMRMRSTIQFHCGWTHGIFPLTLRSPEIGFNIEPPAKQPPT